VKVVYSPRYEVTLPGHVWPTSKYRLIAEALASEHAGPATYAFVEPTAASWETLALVHTDDYLRKLRDNTLTGEDVATLELPWAPQFADVFRLMVGGTVAAASAALEEGAAVHLGGGLHHAFANHGEGFCPLNDVAVAVRALQHANRITRAAIVDLDVHHGNGTAMIFERDESVFTFSMHQQHNYPAFKPRGDLDIGLDDGTGDARYLERLAAALPRVMASGPGLVCYLAGADPFEGDGLGGLHLTKAGLAERDALVVGAARADAVPLVTVLAGGYAADVRDTVDIHIATVRAMANGRDSPRGHPSERTARSERA
jgi:acetoin utilization deacetylase AcuC-like enzyme